MAESSETWHLVEATICDCTDGKHANEHWVAYVPLLHADRLAIAARLFRDHEQARLASRYAEALACEHQVKPEYGVEAHCKHCGIVLTLGWTPYEVLRALSIPDTTEETA